MSNEEKIQHTLERLIEYHRSNSELVPLFTWETDQIAQFMVEEEICSNDTDAYEIIETVTESNDAFYIENWKISYEYVRELWIFKRKMEFGDILRESHSRREIVENRIRTEISNIEPRAFETLLINIFDQIPQVEDPFVRKETHDGGFEMSLRIIDPVTGTDEWVLVQAKQQAKAVSAEQVRALQGTISIESNKHRYRRYRGYFISNKPASVHAVKAAKEGGSLIDFIDLNGLVKLMIDNQIGWKNESLDFANIDLQFWNEVRGEDG